LHTSVKYRFRYYFTQEYNYLTNLLKYYFTELYTSPTHRSRYYFIQEYNYVTYDEDIILRKNIIMKILFLFKNIIM